MLSPNMDSPRNNSKINRLNESCSKIVYSDKQSSFIKWLEKGNSVSIHHQNLQILATGMNKVRKDLPLMRGIFKLANEKTHDLRQNSQLSHIWNQKSGIDTS